MDFSPEAIKNFSDIVLPIISIVVPIVIAILSFRTVPKSSRMDKPYEFIKEKNSLLSALLESQHASETLVLLSQYESVMWRAYLRADYKGRDMKAAFILLVFTVFILFGFMAYFEKKNTLLLGLYLLEIAFFFVYGFRLLKRYWKHTKERDGVFKDVIADFKKKHLLKFGNVVDADENKQALQSNIRFRDRGTHVRRKSQHRKAVRRRLQQSA